MVKVERPIVPQTHANEVDHRRMLAQRANASLPKDGTEGMVAPLLHESYTAAGLPDAALWEGGTVYVGDEDTIAVSDGASWLRVLSGFFLQTGTGAVPQTWRNKLLKVWHVKDFGAVGNGSTDDLAAINTAITAVNAAGGGVLAFDALTYSISGAITWKEKVTLRGANKYGTILKPTGNTSAISATTVTDFWAGIEYLCIDCANITTGSAITMRVNHAYVDHVYIKEMPRFGIEFSFADYLAFTNCLMDRATASSTLNYCLISFSGNYATHIRVENNKFSKVGGMSINGQFIYIISNEMSGHGYSGCVFCDADTLNSNYLIAFNHFHDSNQADDEDSTVISGTETWSRNTLIIGNQIHGMWGAGIQVQAPDCQIIGNRVYNNGTKGASSGAGQIELLSRNASFSYAQPDRALIAFNTVYDDNNLCPYAYHEALIGGSDPAIDVQLIGNSWRGGVTARKLFQGNSTQDDERDSRFRPKLTDETISGDTSLSDDAVLKFTVLASTKYRFRFVIHYDTATAADFKYDVNGPAAPTLVIMDTRSLAPGATAEVITRQSAFAFGPNAILETSGTAGKIVIEGFLHNGANAGSVVFRWAANTSNPGSTIVRACSYAEWAPVT